MPTTSQGQSIIAAVAANVSANAAASLHRSFLREGESAWICVPKSIPELQSSRPTAVPGLREHLTRMEIPALQDREREVNRKQQPQTGEDTPMSEQVAAGPALSTHLWPPTRL